MLLAPGWFLAELEAFDPDLRCRWSNRTGTFHLERKVTRSLPTECYKSDTEHDDYIRAREGYILVGVINPDGFSRSIFDKLRASDLWSNGGWQKMISDIEAYEAEEEEKKDKAFSDDLAAMSGEVYRFLKFREGSRVFNAGFMN